MNRRAFIAGLLVPPMTACIMQGISHVTPIPIVLGITTSPTPTPSATPTPSNTPTPTDTPEPTPRPTRIPLPTRTPTPTPIPVTAEQLEEWFTQYSNHYSIERDKLRRMAVCESHLHPTATNGPYAGLYQFSTSTWKATRREMNMDSNPSLRFNAEEAIRTAAFKISTMGLSPWPNCNK